MIITCPKCGEEMAFEPGFYDWDLLKGGESLGFCPRCYAELATDRTSKTRLTGRVLHPVYRLER